jgi:hypothetical protein
MEWDHVGKNTLSVSNQSDNYQRQDIDLLKILFFPLFANKIRVIIIGNQWLMAIILATQEQ